MGVPRLRFLVALAAVMTAVTLLVCSVKELPLSDPDDDVTGPAYIRFPLFLLAAFLVDVIPRVVVRARRQRTGSRAALHEVLAERWTSRQVRFMFVGLIAWYVCYAAFRNLKNAVPFVNHTLWDDTMTRADKLLWFGHDPAAVLHAAFGQGVAAEVFSTIYVAWIVLIPLSLTWALVWTRHRTIAAWFVTAIGVDWALGAAGYFLAPTLGPIYADPATFSGLRRTMVTGLQDSMYHDRLVAMNDPAGHHTLQSIAAFPSLHVGLMATMCLLLELWGARRAVKVAAWIFLAATSLATIYLGWHFFVDTLGGLLVGSAAVWISAMATGNHVGWRPKLIADHDDVRTVLQPPEPRGAAPAQPSASDSRTA